MNENITTYIYQLELLHKSELEKKNEIIQNLRKQIEVLKNTNENINNTDRTTNKNKIQEEIINELKNINC